MSRNRSELDWEEGEGYRCTADCVAEAEIMEDVIKICYLSDEVFESILNLKTLLLKRQKRYDGKINVEVCDETT